MIGPVLNFGSLLLGVVSKFYPDSKDITSAANVADRVAHSYNVVSTTSVHESAQRSVIAPMVAIEAGAVHQEYMSDLIQIIMLRDIVATLTHLSLQGSLGMGVKVENLIGSINPKRAGLLALAGIEAMDTNIRAGNEEAKVPEVLKADDGVEYVNVGGKSMPDLAEYVPLAVGKTVLASVQAENGNKYDFPLTFRQIPVPMSMKDLKLVFSAAKSEDGMFARMLMVKTGEITVPDLISGKDIIKERFKIKNEDMSGYYREAMARETNNRIAAVRTGVISVNNLANSFVFTQDGATQLELEVGKRFSSPSARADIFKAVKANTIVVCNEDRGMFTFYTHGETMPAVYTRKDLAVKSKKDVGSNSMADLVKLLNGGV